MLTKKTQNHTRMGFLFRSLRNMQKDVNLTPNFVMPFFASKKKAKYLQINNFNNSSDTGQVFPENFKYYVSGFVDGEGCFSVSFRVNTNFRLGIETRLSFSIAQKISTQNLQLLTQIRDMFQGGSIRKDNTGCYKYETRSIAHIKKNIVPFFKTYPLYTSKLIDFGFFCQICSLAAANQHLNKTGLITILKLAAQMNLSGTRRYTIQSWLEKLEKLP